MDAPLYRLTIKTPCKMKWSEMRGDDRVRYCNACRLNVHNVAAMSAKEIDELLRPGGRVCVRLYRRSDGTVVTGDCRRVWQDRRSEAISLLSEGANVVLAIVLLLVIAVATITLFGDNIRRYFGSCAGDACGGGFTISGSSSVSSSPTGTVVTRKGLKDFGKANSY